MSEDELPDRELELQGLKNNFPSVELAYPLAIASYDSVQKRLDVVEGRLQTLLAFVAPVTVAVMAAAAGKNVPFSSRLFIAAIVSCVGGFALGIYTRLAGKFIVINPGVLSEKWLHFSGWQFKRNVIHLSGKHFQVNASIVARKGRLTLIVALIFLLEALFLGLWIVNHNL